MSIDATIVSSLRPDVPLAPLTTLGIGGRARYFLRAESVDQIIAAISWAEDRALRLVILGGGSNVLIADDGIDGLVVQNDLRGVTVGDAATSVFVKVAAGEPWDAFVERAVLSGWAGIECLSGIPGLIGATPIQNIGAYGQEVSETIVRVEALDRATRRVRWFTNEECGFGYRSSRFKNIDKDRYVILSVTFRLTRDGKAVVRYQELRRYLDESGTSTPSLSEVREAVLAIRRRKGMLLDSNDPDTRSDGSFFMNPVVAASELDGLLARAGAGLPHFDAADGSVKLSAAWLIENAGFPKGYERGNVGISSKHSLAIINRGGGTARDVLALVELIQRTVRDKFGVELHPEPAFIGF
ncbi:MAG TPA: UDP-N-acetylmuramate dehydrogenase [Thermoanaerobaculia bacterium]|nr:UDP-N-acetylmuramate dehydrogenase [Thermoanaerobaculia bacterium]